MHMQMTCLHKLNKYYRGGKKNKNNNNMYRYIYTCVCKMKNRFIEYKKTRALFPNSIYYRWGGYSKYVNITLSHHFLKENFYYYKREKHPRP